MRSFFTLLLHTRATEKAITENVYIKRISLVRKWHLTVLHALARERERKIERQAKSVLYRPSINPVGHQANTLYGYSAIMTCSEVDRFFPLCLSLRCSFSYLTLCREVINFRRFSFLRNRYCRLESFALFFILFCFRSHMHKIIVARNFTYFKIYL